MMGLQQIFLNKTVYKYMDNFNVKAEIPDRLKSLYS